MNTIKITRSDLDEKNYYKEDGIAFTGPDFKGSVEIEGGLGVVRFRRGIYVTGKIAAAAGSGIRAGEGIRAGWGIRAGGGIEAGWCIRAGSGIEAGEGIRAGGGIRAGEGIECKLTLAFEYKLFAGTACWTNNADKYVKCGKLEKGTIAYGDLEETGLPEEVPEEMTMQEVCKALGKTIKIKK